MICCCLSFVMIKVEEDVHDVKAWNRCGDPCNDYYHYFEEIMPQRLFWKFSGLDVIEEDVLTKESSKNCSWPLMCKSGDDWWHHHWLELVEDKEWKSKNIGSHVFFFSTSKEWTIDYKLCNNDKRNIKSKWLPSFPNDAQAWSVLGWRRSG